MIAAKRIAPFMFFFVTLCEFPGGTGGLVGKVKSSLKGFTDFSGVGTAVGITALVGIGKGVEVGSLVGAGVGTE